MKSSFQKLLLRFRLRLAFWIRSHPLDIPDDGRPRILCLLMADYCNLGDLAINKAQSAFLKHRFPSYQIVVIPMRDTLRGIKALRSSIRKHDLITLTGGGNTGDRYDDIEFLRELVITTFPNNRILSFPQTIEFSRTLYGRWALRRAVKAFNSHPDLTLMCRDSKSLDFARQYFSHSNLSLCPDVALTLPTPTDKMKRSGILFVLRSDSEIAVDRRSQDEMSSCVIDLGPIRSRDTHFGEGRVTSDEAEAALLSMWTEISISSCIVTDRLHAMIFAVITNTPCVVIDSGNHKVGQVYEDWLSDCPIVSLHESGSSNDLRDKIIDVMQVKFIHDPERARTLIDSALQFAQAR